MKIDASRYTLFWSNPERYRLRELWKLAPIEPKTDTFASLLTYGRRRGTCFHELMDADYRGVPQNEAIQSLKDGGFGNREIEAALRMVVRVRELYSGETYLAHESVFEYPIPGSPHCLTGRIDHILAGKGVEEPTIGDWKTSKRRTKKDFAALVRAYCGSPQPGFYLLGARSLGFDCRTFRYRVVQDRQHNTRVEVTEHEAPRTGLELRQLERSVHITCELIGFLKATFGAESPWPNLYEAFDRGYGALEGRKMYEGYMPEGFTEKVEHLSTMMEDEEGEDASGV